jgi:hypothetical protein
LAQHGCSQKRAFKNSRWLSTGKLRGSFGLTGSDAIGDYQFLDTYTLSTSSYNDVVGFYPSRLYNPYFSWEKTKTGGCDSARLLER